MRSVYALTIEGPREAAELGLAMGEVTGGPRAPALLVKYTELRLVELPTQHRDRRRRGRYTKSDRIPRDRREEEEEEDEEEKEGD